MQNRGTTTLIQVTEWMSREQALKFANDTREFQPLFAKKIRDRHVYFSVCRRPGKGEEIAEGFDLNIEQENVFKTI